MFNKKTIKDVPIDHKVVLLRADYNVPLEKDESTGGLRIDDDYRITQSLPTLKFLIKAGCKVIITSHLGRPDGKKLPECSLEPVAKRLSKLLDKPVEFVPDCIGDRVMVAVKKMKPGQVILLENVRFYPEEEANNLDFAKKLVASSQAQYFVQDCFGVAHREHASIVGVTHYLPAVAGFLLEKEVVTITEAMEKPKRPLVVVLGGAKISDKIKVIERFIQIADQIIIGGAMANTFLAAQDVPVGKSKFEPGQEKEVERIYNLAHKKVGGNVRSFLLMPTDFVVAAEVSADVKARRVNRLEIPSDQYALDIGPNSTEAVLQAVKSAGSVIWNGPLGMAEYPAFAKSSEALANELAKQKSKTFSLIGGGDTADFVLHWDKQKGGSFSFVSTGGGASLELMAGEKLPGIEALLAA
jgi:phosphoglycerate kinase